MTCADCNRTEGTCAACGGTLGHVLCLGDAPLANRLRSAADDPVVRHPLHLARCRACSLVQLVSRPAPEVLFDGSYPYRSSQNPGMVASASLLVERMVRGLGLGPGDAALEVGSNDGYLLRHYGRAGVRAVGYDPASDAAEEARQYGVDTVCEFFGPATGADRRGEFRVAHANNVLAHVDDPDGLVAGIAAALDPEGVLVVETPWLVDLIDGGAFDTIYEEHRFYWSAAALSTILVRHGLHPFHLEHLPGLHGGSLRVYAAKRPGWSLALKETLALEESRGLGGGGWAARFETIHRGQVERLRGWWEATRPAAAYAASAKGTVLFHAIGDAPGYVFDSTPAKQGKWTPYGAVVVAPSELERLMPADCVLTAWNWASTIAARARPYTEAGGRLWRLIPHPERVA